MSYALEGILLVGLLSHITGGDGRVLAESKEPGDFEKLVTFQLYTRQNPNNGAVLTVGDKVRLVNSGFKASLPTVLCTHGFLDSAETRWMVRIRQDILKEEEVNFITVDYSEPAKNLLYNEVVNFTKQAGRYAGEFLKFLETEGKFDVGKAHLIGHSLGGQLLSFAAKVFPPKTIGRITALDPAGPLFENAPESERLNPDSAKIADVIHTCIFLVGMKKPVGTIDFYPNGGFLQPGCPDFDLSCHHARSHEYFYETIKKFNGNKYQAKKCDALQNALNGTCYGQQATMGYHLNYSSPGIYYLKTDNK